MMHRKKAQLCWKATIIMPKTWQREGPIAINFLQFLSTNTRFIHTNDPDSVASWPSKVGSSVQEKT